MANLQYLTKVTKAYLKPSMDKSCPFCSCEESKVLGSKYALVQLRQCQNCSLMFRFPKETPDDNRDYYQSDYSEGITTDLPERDQLKALLDTQFKGSRKDFSQKIELVKSHISEGKVLDYGCSWGYGAWQFAQSGFEATGFEISEPRAAFGREHLGITAIDNAETLDNMPPNSFDVIFSSHVLEHLPDISTTFKLFEHLVRPGGIVALFVPDCDGCEDTSVFDRKKNFAFGEKHTIAYSSNFLESAFQENGFSVISVEHTYEGKLPELSIIAQKK